MKKYRGFTLWEIIVIIAIIGVLAAVAVPAFYKAPSDALKGHQDIRPGARDGKDADYAIVRVYYATDRNLTDSTEPDKVYGAERSVLTLGICEVSIPRDHRMGELEAPSIWRLEFREDPEKHVMLLNVETHSENNFFNNLKERIQQSGKKSAFIFIHGYNVTFQDAARRTAQMSYDLAFDGAAVFYSWPSQGKTAAYTVDEQSIEWSRANLGHFLDKFFEKSEADDVYLIAHSMGNRALTRTLAHLLDSKPAYRKRLREVILTAPDIDADVFKRDIAPALTATGSPVTLYASSNDLALAASRKVHGHPRAGDSGQNLMIIPGIETIDASSVDTGFLGHSYYAETRSVLSDIFYLLRNNQRADERFGLRSAHTPSGKYWVFRP